MAKILIATKNDHKVDEFKSMLEPFGYEVLSLNDLTEEFDILEDGQTFEENAYIKAKTIYDKLHIPVISDDSGFCIKYFNDYPGIYSARFRQEDSYEVKNQFLLDELSDVKERDCKYVCVICYIDINGKAHYYRGECHGMVSEKMCGDNGFGYDPIFYYPPFEKTMAELSMDVKNSISHRHLALEKLMEDLGND